EARGARSIERRVPDRGPRQPQRHLRQPQADRVGNSARKRRRGADRQVSIELHQQVSTPTKTSATQRLLTIGTVTRRLQEEVPEISISKIRYLEDQGLLAPRRTQGGYRLFSEEDVERLETILRLQRDEFLPLRVIREELSTASPKAKRRRRVASLEQHQGELPLDE